MKNHYDFSVIRMLRKRLNLTLEKLAEAAGLTYSTTASIEANKTSPSLKTLDALACALQISTSDLISLSENRLVQIREAQSMQQGSAANGTLGLEHCRIAMYGKAKMIRVYAKAGQEIHAMAIHEDCNEFCYVLSGQIRFRIEDRVYEFGPDKTLFFDGGLDHAYTAVEDCEFMTIHIPKDIRKLEVLLSEKRGK